MVNAEVPDVGPPKKEFRLANLRGVKEKLRRGKLESCPGIYEPSASGKIMRPLPSYFKREDEELLAGNDPYMFLDKKVKKDPEEGKSF